MAKKARDTSSWQQRFTSSDTATTWKIELEIKGDTTQILAAMQTNQAVAVSDGSYQADSGAAAWIIEGPMSANRIQGSMITPGTTGDHSSFRSKAAGIYGILLTLSALQDNAEDIMGNIEIACDGKSVLERIKSKKQLDPFVAHADLLGACRRLANKLPWKINFQHIKGHQDKGHPTVLSRKAWLNIEADLLAKACITPIYHGQIRYQLPYKPWHLEIAGKRPTKHPKQALRKAMNRPPA